MLPIHPDDRWLLGMRWEGSVFVDTALPFGLWSAPKILTAVADTLEWRLVSTWMGKRSCMRKELESLRGKSQHACIVAKLGSSFLRQLFQLQAATKKSHHHVPVWGAVTSDLAWWDTFLESWNKIATICHAFPPAMPVAPPHHVYTDAAGGFSCRAIWGRHWFQYMWSSTFQGRAIATQELLPIVI